VSDEVIDTMWSETAGFFDRPVEEKVTYISANQEEYPFGYIKYKGEILSAGKQVETSDGKPTAAPDLKEMFSLGPGDPLAGFPTRQFPTKPDGFAAAWTTYYDTLGALARALLKSFALALDLPSEDYFEQYVQHHASACRALNYPHLEGAEKPVPGQLRASAHTDYGAMTILRTDAPGLQVSKDKDDPDWVDVPFVKGAFIINLGDLMKRWTNDQWLSTLHRVVNPPEDASKRENWSENKTGNTRRQSVAFFYNTDRDAMITNLTPNEAKYDPIVAGDFLMQKHLAATIGTTKEEL
jgi:isopenicillin N synthase-like dioxygenase